MFQNLTSSRKASSAVAEIPRSRYDSQEVKVSFLGQNGTKPRPRAQREIAFHSVLVKMSRYPISEMFQLIKFHSHFFLSLHGKCGALALGETISSPPFLKPRRPQNLSGWTWTSISKKENLHLAFQGQGSTEMSLQNGCTVVLLVHH